MGFSVSGTTAVVFLALFISAGTLYTSVSDATDRVTDARDDQSERLLAQQNTAIELQNVTYDAGNDALLVNATNDGTTELSVDDTTILVDNEPYSTANATVDGRSGTDLWLPGERLEANLTVSERPARVKVVTETGVAEATEV